MNRIIKHLQIENARFHYLSSSEVDLTPKVLKETLGIVVAATYSTRIGGRADSWKKKNGKDRVWNTF